MLIFSTSGILMALAILATSVADPVPVPQVDVCLFGGGVTVGAPKATIGSLFNINVIPTTALTPSSRLGYDPFGSGAQYARLRGTATKFNLTNNVLTGSVGNNGNIVQTKSGEGLLRFYGPAFQNLKFSEQQYCVGNTPVNILTVASAQGTKFSVTRFATESYVGVYKPGQGLLRLPGSCRLANSFKEESNRKEALLQVIPA